MQPARRRVRKSLQPTILANSSSRASGQIPRCPLIKTGALMDRFQEMQIFMAVAEEEGFAAAARRLKISPPA